jgi:hypothetical protein
MGENGKIYKDKINQICINRGNICSELNQNSDSVRLIGFSNLVLLFFLVRYSDVRRAGERK